MKRPNSNDNPWRAVALTSAIGIDLVVCLAAGYFFGDWLSGTLGGQFLVVGWIYDGACIGYHQHLLHD
ncbi:hypothetical protein [Paenibacillus roseipurpureus]|uniref:Uncharacterized protein n=1 Tax=Paenibacillus roseopurpureus TaxID=2918901 RepID=A0AA96LNZ1_9BACL|nr:hypothetical protein [Paenibacillus sp. MBLB1832]WNR44637.1 hypothetical protein MJB10_00265 [Paenibacillus sp. MBLB1832]